MGLIHLVVKTKVEKKSQEGHAFEIQKGVCLFETITLFVGSGDNDGVLG